MNPIRVAIVIAFMALTSLQLTACSDQLPRGDAGELADDHPDAGGVRAGQCMTAEDCPAHNEICVGASFGVPGTCAPPANEGACAPGPGDSTSNCYPGARCQPVPMPPSTQGGLCSFGAPSAPIFNFDRSTPKISANAPNAQTVLRPADGIRLSWTPPAVAPDAITVAVLMKNVPQRADANNRIRNAADIVWIWSSTAPGASSQPGNIPLEAGRRSLLADGSLGLPFGTNLLAAGRYWWFVYVVRNGLVVTASDVLNFRVGADFATVMCETVDQCTAGISGELPDTVACIGGRCRRRCASSLDCPPVDAMCVTRTAISDLTGSASVPRGGYCAPRLGATP